MLHGPDTDSTTAEKRAEPHHTPQLGPGVKTILARDGGTVSLGPVPGPVVPSTSILQTSTRSKNNTKSQSTTVTYGGGLFSSSTSEEWALTETSIPHSTTTVNVVLSAKENDVYLPPPTHTKSYHSGPTHSAHAGGHNHTVTVSHSDSSHPTGQPTGSPYHGPPPPHSNNVRAALEPQELTLTCTEPLLGPKGATGSVDITQQCVDAGWGCWEFGYLPGPKSDGWYEKCLAGCTCTITQKRDEEHVPSHTFLHSRTNTLTTMKTLPSVHQSHTDSQTKHQSHSDKTTKASTTSDALDAPKQPPVARSPAVGQLSCMIFTKSAPGQPLLPTNITNTCVDSGYYCSNNKVYWNQQQTSSSFYEECQVTCKCDGSVNISRDVDNVADTEDSDMSCHRGIAGVHGVTGYTDITGDCIKMGFYCFAGSVIVPPKISGAEYNQCSAVCKCKDTTKMARGVNYADTLTYWTGPYHTITTFKPVIGTWPLSRAVVTDAPSMKDRRDEGDLPGLGPGPADMTITNPSVARRDETLTKTEHKTRSRKPEQSTASFPHPHGRPTDVPPSMEKRTSHAKCPSDTKVVTGKLGNTNAACCCPTDHPNFDGSDEPYVCLSTDGTSVKPYAPLECTHGADQWAGCCEWS